MNLELYIARRLNFKRDRHHGLSPSIPIAVAGVALSVIVMMVAIAVVLGFKREIREKVMGFDSQITITASQEAYDHTDYRPITPVALTDTLRRILYETLPDGARLSLTCTRPAMLKTENDFLGIVLKGMSADSDLSFIESNLTDGIMPDLSDKERNNSVIISRNMAVSLGLSVGDKVHGYFFIDDNVRARNLTVSAIYESHFGEYDALYAFCGIDMMQRLLGLAPDEGSAIDITGIPADRIASDTEAVYTALGQAYHENLTDRWYVVDNVLHSGALYFNWLELLDTNVIVILILMSLVSGFTLISSLFIIILERVRMIGLLKAIGATGGMIRRIFIYLAERLVLMGIIIGNTVAITLLILQSKFHLIPLDPEAYYLNYVPVELNLWHIIILNTGIIAVSSLMLLLPSHIIARISPAQTMRYE